MPPPKTLIKVAYQGIRGAYSEQAALLLFDSRIELLPTPSFREVFEAVERKRATWGLVPVENSVAGSIHENLDLLFCSSLVPKVEMSLKISHCLVASRSAHLTTIKKVYSHPQALAQCTAYFHRLPQVEVIPFFDTAGAAQYVAKVASPEVAAIASRVAAEHYGLKILARGIQNQPRNYTRFLGICKAQTEILAPWKKKTQKYAKTSLCLVPKGGSREFLHCLEPLYARRVKVGKIEPRPLGPSPWQYVYHVDFWRDESQAAFYEKALTQVESRCDQFKLLGTYQVVR